MWCNVHGFDEGPGSTYWVGMDLRSFGIRVADYIIKCKNKSTYDKWIDKASRDTEHVLSAMKDASELNLINPTIRSEGSNPFLVVKIILPLLKTISPL